MPDPSPSKLFHAIVGLGLAAVGCGGQILTQNEKAGAPDGPPDARGAPSGDAADARVGIEDGGVTTTFDAESAEADAAVEIDAVAARDAARDVAREAWPPPPIK